MHILKIMIACISIALLTACHADVSASLDIGLGQRKAGVAERLDEELKKVGVDRFVDRNYKTGVVRHIVLFRYRETVSKEDRNEVTRRFLDLKRSLRKGVPYIVSIEEGAQISGENADRGFEQAFVVTFGSQGDRNYYVGKPLVASPDFYDPAHQAFKEFVGKFLAPEGVLVFDYSVSEIAS